MTRLACGLAALLWIAPRQGPEQRSIEQELAALIEKTNALESFHLVYDLKSESNDSSRQGTLEFIHRAPDLGHFRVRIEDFASEMWVDEALCSSRSDTSGRIGEWRVALYPDTPPAVLLMNELFPPTEKLMGPGVCFDLKLRHDSKTAETHVSPVVGRKLSRTCLFGWLEEMRRRASELSAEEHALILDDPRCRFIVSRESGLLERAEISFENGTFEVRLRASHLDEPLDDERSAVPEEVRFLKLDPGMTRSLKAQFAPGFIRQEAFQRLECLLVSELRPWNESVRDDWRAFLEVMHREMSGEHNADRFAKQRENIDQFVEWVEKQRAANDSPERGGELEKTVTVRRAGIEKDLESWRTSYVDSLPPIEFKRSQPRQELFDIEKQVIAELWNELVREPVLKTFDEKLAEALKR